MIISNEKKKMEEGMKPEMDEMLKDMKRKIMEDGMSMDEAISAAVSFLAMLKEAMMMKPEDKKNNILANANETLNGAILTNAKSRLAGYLFQAYSKPGVDDLSMRISKYLKNAHWNDKLAYRIKDNAEWKNCSIEKYLSSSEGKNDYLEIVRAAGGHSSGQFQQNSIRDYVGLLEAGESAGGSSSSYDGERSVDLRVPMPGAAKSDLEKLAEILRQNSGSKKFSTNVPFVKPDDNLASILKKLASK